MENKLDIYQKVAQFLINFRTKKPREIICHSIVMGILAEKEGRLSIDELINTIHEKWGIVIPKERVRNSINSLRDSKWLQGEKGQYFMDGQQKESYQQAIKNRISFFEEVEQQWIDSMERIGNLGSLAENEKRLIIEDFRAALDGLCELHASRIANFLTGNATELAHPFIGNEIINCLPASASRTEKMLTIEEKIFPLFFHDSDPNRARYVAGMAQTHLRRTIFEVETQGHSILGAKIKDINVFLDTNMIFHLLGINGLQQKDTAEHLISMNKSLGINTLVDRCSIREFRNVLYNSLRNNIGPRVPVGIFTEVKRVIQEPSYKPQIEFKLPDDPFALMFWASLEEDFVKKSKPEDFSNEWLRFIAKFDAVDVILSVKYRVDIVGMGDKLITDDTDLKETTELVLQAAKHHHFGKRDTTAKHDATLLLVVNTLRETEKPVLLPSNYWILSADRSLTTMEHRMLRDGKIDLSRVLQIGSWTELMMPFLTIQLVDESKNAMLVAKALGEPFEHFDVERVQAKDIAEVLQRVPEVYERGAELVLRCAANRHFCETVGKAVSREGVTPKLIDEAVIQAFEGVREKMEGEDQVLIEEIERRAASEQVLSKELTKERNAREKAEKRLENLERFLRRIGLTAILLALAAGASYLAYRLISPEFSGINLNVVFWIVGNLYLLLWVIFSVIYKLITPRIIAGTYLLGATVFTIPLFWVYSKNTGELIATVMFLLAIVTLETYLIKTSWLDIRILFRSRNN